MDKNKISEMADNYSTLFIQECTKFPTDSSQHRELTRLFEEFGETLHRHLTRHSSGRAEVCGVCNRGDFHESWCSAGFGRVKPPAA